MPIIETLFGAFGGLIAVAAAVKFLGGAIVEHFLNRKLETYKVRVQAEIDRRLAEHEQRAVHRGELARRQLDAIQEVWSIFGPTSISRGQGRLIILGSPPCADVSACEDFCCKIVDVFSTRAGLYMPKEARDRLFALRDFIRDKLIVDGQRGQDRAITEAEVTGFRELRTSTRLALRAAIGTDDLKVAAEHLSNQTDDS